MCCFFPLTPVPVPLPVRLPPPLLVPPLRGLPLLPPPSKELPFPLPFPLPPLPLPLSVPSDLPTISVSPASLMMIPLPLPLPDPLADVALAVNLLILIGRGSGRIPPAGKERGKICKKSKLLRERMSMQHHDLFELLSQKKIVMKKDPSTQFPGIELLAVMARSAGPVKQHFPPHTLITQCCSFPTL